MYVHPVGAIHMIRPERLLASAGRIYGDRMETLWGEFLPGPRGVRDRRWTREIRVRLGDRTLRVAYAPGHAKHHVAYFEEDTRNGLGWRRGRDPHPAGGRDPGHPPVPDIDVEAWNASMERVMEWNPDRVIPTHFGTVEGPGAHFAELRDELARTGREYVQASIANEDPANPETAVGRLPGPPSSRPGSRMTCAPACRPSRSIPTLTPSARATPGGGLARYWRKRSRLNGSWHGRGQGRRELAGSGSLESYLTTTRRMTRIESACSPRYRMVERPITVTVPSPRSSNCM